MVLNQLVLLGLSLLVHTYTNGNLMDPQTKYLNKMADRRLKHNPFCNVNLKTYMAYCEMAFASLRSNPMHTMYKYAYVDYYGCSLSEVNKIKCIQNSVTIIEEMLQTKEIRQEMAVCSARPVVTEMVDDQETNNNIRDNIRIYVLHGFMVIFEKIDEGIVRVVETLEDVEVPNPDSIDNKLFVHPQPQLAAKVVLSEKYVQNIINTTRISDIFKQLQRRDQFWKLCILAVDSDSSLGFQTEKDLYKPKLKLINKIDVAFDIPNEEENIIAERIPVHICKGKKGDQNSFDYAVGTGSSSYAVVVYQYLDNLRRNKLYAFKKEILHVHTEFLEKIE